MPQPRYFIERVEEDWFIHYGDEDFGPYKTQREAMLFAIEAAHKLSQYGDPAQVCLMGENGHFRPEWTFGQDAYPPSI